MYRQNLNIRFGGPVTPTVKKLMIINGVIFLIQQFSGLFIRNNPIEYVFGLHHIGFFYEFKIWQLFTYMFLHGGWTHIIFNLLTLWMFAGEIEQVWGSKLFLRYYLICGVGAGIFIALLNYIVFVKYGFSTPTIGASGAIYGLLLAYGMIWPDREILLWFLVPIKVKYLLIGFGIFEFFGTLSTLRGFDSNISHIGHIGGLITGFLYFQIKTRGLFKGSRLKFKMNDNVFIWITKKIRLRKKQKQIDKRIKAKKIIDELLEKIARHGMSSLTPQEKKQLDWARKNYYPEENETMH